MTCPNCSRTVTPDDLCPCSDPVCEPCNQIDHAGRPHRCVRCGDVAVEGGLCVRHERGRRWVS